MQRRTAVLAITTIGAALGGAARGDLPAYAEKPETWHSGLSAEPEDCNGSDVIWDDELTFWFEQAQLRARALIAGDWELSFRCTFTQCFGGGFLTEMDKRARLDDWGANSASKDAIPASGKLTTTMAAKRAMWVSPRVPRAFIRELLWAMEALSAHGGAAPRIS